MKEKSDKLARKVFKSNMMDDGILKLDDGLDHIKEVVRPSSIPSRRTKIKEFEVLQTPSEESPPLSQMVSNKNLKR